MLERHSAWLVVNTQVKVCSRETHSPSWASETYGYKAFQIIQIHKVINSGRVHTTQHRTDHSATEDRLVWAVLYYIK